MSQPLVSAAQCRAARALLGWTQANLADQAGIARRTVAHFEVGRRALLVRTRREIMQTFERAGIGFLWPMPGSGEGVQITRLDNPIVQAGTAAGLGASPGAG